jgi:hypothetical protein
MYCFFCRVLFVCKCVLYYCHRVTTQLRLTNISYHIMTYTSFSLPGRSHAPFPKPFEGFQLNLVLEDSSSVEESIIYIHEIRTFLWIAHIHYQNTRCQPRFQYESYTENAQYDSLPYYKADSPNRLSLLLQRAFRRFIEKWPPTNALNLCYKLV